MTVLAPFDLNLHFWSQLACTSSQEQSYRDFVIEKCQMETTIQLESDTFQRIQVKVSHRHSVIHSDYELSSTIHLSWARFGAYSGKQNNSGLCPSGATTYQRLIKTIPQI